MSREIKYILTIDIWGFEGRCMTKCPISNRVMCGSSSCVKECKFNCNTEIEIEDESNRICRCDAPIHANEVHK